MIRKVKVGKIIFGNGQLPLISGPCVIESREHALKMAESLKKITDSLGFPFIFKSSFDKANRTSSTAFRGPGMEIGLAILAEIKKEFDIPVLTDIHLPQQAGPAAEVADILQIPSFLSRQTDLLNAAAKTGRAVNIKKGQFLAPLKMKYAVNKVLETGNNNVLVTERGTSFGYDHLISDMRAIPQIQESTHCPVIFDATHSAQVPSSTGGKTGGAREYIPTLAKAAVAAGCDGIFMEVHDNADAAKSDAATQWPLERLEKLLSDLKRIKAAVTSL
ncbi:MAG: 3-deoxy-8-phosphooctulonate synthase [Candidatus Neomarinimicrobiota bacterium]